MYIEEIGNLFLYDVLLSYIYPRVFICEDEFSCKYLFYEMESNDKNDSWLVTKIRKTDYYDLVDQKKAIQSVYKKATKHDLFSITKIYGETDQIVFSPEYRVWIEKLPIKQVFAEKGKIDDIAVTTLNAARETGSTTLDIRLFPGTDRHFVPQYIMTSLLKSFSSLVDSIFGKRHSNSLRVCTAPGSCVVRFSFEDQINLFDESNATYEVGIINRILRSDSIEKNLEQVKNKGIFVQSYSNLLKTIKKTRNAVQFTSAFPNSTDIEQIELTAELISKKSEQMENIYNEKVTKQVLSGELIALDTKSKKFKFQMRNDDADFIILGTIDDSVLSESREVPGSYNAVIQKTEYIDQNDYSSRRSYHLLELRKTNLDT